MLSLEPNILFVDDKEVEVSEIIYKYRNDGVGVKFFNANVATGDQPPDVPFSDVSLIFLDLFYTDEFDPELCSNWVYHLIPEKSFYVLVIWSKDTQYAEGVTRELATINRSPYLCIVKQKSAYRTNESFDFNQLKTDIDTELEAHPELQELAFWKKSIKHSSNVIIGHLANSADAVGSTRKLQKIIAGHGGSCFTSNQNPGQFPEKKREVLFDALDKMLISNAKGTRPKKIISESNKQGLYTIGEGIQSDIDTRLNSWFHFELHSKPLAQDIVAPGLICEFRNDSLRKAYGLTDDEKVSKYIECQKTEFEKDKSKAQILEICMLISRPCDIAQNKFGKNLKLISGLVVKKPLRKDNSGKRFKVGTKPDSIKLFDHLALSDDECDVVLLFDFRYIFSVSESDFKTQFENIKIFNKELLSEMQVEYSSYSSRLGITQII